MIQRKINHILKAEGNGSNFQYLPELAIPFDLQNPILVTEKVDGSTLQVKEGVLYKRYDNFTKGDSRKLTASEEERYRLDKCDRNNPAEQWYWKSFEAYRSEFEDVGKAYPWLWLYFEALGGKIGARYKNLDPTIRVFDSGSDAGFYDFEKETAPLLSSFRLPIVAHCECLFLSLEHMLNMLSRDTSKDSGLAPYQLEGWVLRQKKLIGKIRVEDLKKLRGFNATR